MVTSQATLKSLGWPPRVVSWPPIGQNSRLSHNKVQGGIFREETHSIGRVGQFGRYERHWLCSCQWFFFFFIVAVQLLSCVQLFVTPCTAACQASLSLTVSWSLLKLMSIDSVMPSNHLIFCGPLLFLPSIFPSISVFSYELALHIRWPEYWNFSISPSNECSRLISFRIDWFDLFAVQGTLKSLLQNRSPKASILQRSLGERVGISRS